MVNITFSLTNLIVSLIITIFIILSIQFMQMNKINDSLETISNQKYKPKSKSKTKPIPKVTNTQITIEKEQLPTVISPQQIAASNIEAVNEYDRRQLYDPLEQPTRRVARHELPPEYFRRMIDIASRGYPDNFTQYGILKQVCEHGKKNNQNKILRLFSRQEYPGSNRYEYFTALNSGLDQIKVHIETRGKRELFDGDKVFIKELDEYYEVQLHKFDSPKYYPDIVW